MAIARESAVPVALPARYRRPWKGEFMDRVSRYLVPEMTVLDVGSGRHATVPVTDRPRDCTYIGLDLSGDELAAAGPGAYTTPIVADLTDLRPELVARVDLIVSWQVLEHVEDLSRALRNCHAYLRPGGHMVALFSGTFSAFGIINRLLPPKVGTEVAGRLMRRKNSDRPVFPAYYDRCYARALKRELSHWRQAEIEPLYRGATYFHFARPIARAYLAYENVVARRRIADLATHYVIDAQS